jgi:hypothetical protein
MSSDQQSLKDEIADLERRLHDAKAKLGHSDAAPAPLPPTPYNDTGLLSQPGYSCLDVLMAAQRSMHSSCSPTLPCLWGRLPSAAV